MLKHFFVWLNYNFNMLKNPYLNDMEDLPKLPDSIFIKRKLTTAELEFIFSQVEKRVKETADEGDRLNSKSLTIIGICLTFITSLIGFVISNKYNNIPLSCASIYLIFALSNI